MNFAIVIFFDFLYLCINPATALTLDASPADGPYQLQNSSSALTQTMTPPSSSLRWALIEEPQTVSVFLDSGLMNYFIRMMFNKTGKQIMVFPLPDFFSRLFLLKLY